MQRILITGVSGFLGTNLVHFFSSKKDIEVFGNSRHPLKVADQFHGYAVQVLPAVTAEALNHFGIDTIIHLAGIAHDISGEYKEADYFKVNYEGTIALYDEFLKSRANRFIFLSSIKAAVDTGREVIDEDVKPAPSSPYGRSKLKAEQYILDHSNGIAKQYYLIRPCMIHGPGNKGNLNLLYKFIKRGLPYPLGAFQNQRSFLSIDNFNFVMDHLVRGTIPSGIYNVSDEGSLSTNELIRVMAEAVGKKERIWKVPPGLVRILFSLYNRKMLHKLTDDMVVSNAKLLRSIGGTLPVSIEEGLRKTVQSFNQS